ncbi:MAG TPA: hypothetical protein VFA63_15290 [Pseudonocardiaceae bacterium]|nr:hypothetical protein [Pseudonocardiaceae bacterium]
MAFHQCVDDGGWGGDFIEEPPCIPVVHAITAVSYAGGAHGGPPARAGLDDQVPIV